MHAPKFPLFLLAALAPLALCHDCLNVHEVNAILGRWNLIFATGKGNLADKAVTADAPIYDESIVAGAPYAVGAAALAAFLSSGVPTVTYAPSEKVFAFHSCDMIAQRWVENTVVTGLDPNATAPAGKAVSFYGIDLLTVDLKTKLISNATTNQDDLTFYKGVGEKAGAIGLSC